MVTLLLGLEQIRFQIPKCLDKQEKKNIFPVHSLLVWKGRLIFLGCSVCFLSFVSVALNAGFDMLQFWVWWVQTRARAEELCSCREKQRGGYNV